MSPPLQLTPSIPPKRCEPSCILYSMSGAHRGSCTCSCPPPSREYREGERCRAPATTDDPRCSNFLRMSASKRGRRFPFHFEILSPPPTSLSLFTCLCMDRAVTLFFRFAPTSPPPRWRGRSQVFLFSQFHSPGSLGKRRGQRVNLASRENTPLPTTSYWPLFFSENHGFQRSSPQLRPCAHLNSLSDCSPLLPPHPPGMPHGFPPAEG